MRLNLRLTSNTEPVPYAHLHWLTGALHKWLGPDNALHDGPSLYSFGWLRGGTGADGHLQFPEGATWRISFHATEAAKRCIAGIMQDPTVCAGMRVHEVKEQATPAFADAYCFKVDAPVVARRVRDNGSRAYLLWDDDEVDEVLTQTLHTKMAAAGLEVDDERAHVRFDRSYAHAHTKLAEIKGVKHRGSICPVVVEGAPETVRFAWKVGVGELTGSGFGALQ